MPEPPALERTWRPSWPCPVSQVLGSLRRGAGDPTYLRDPDGTVWKGCTEETASSVSIRAIGG